jgi:hypothetical protein
MSSYIVGRPWSYYVPEEVTSPLFAEAFRRGCKGLKTDAKFLQPGPLAMFGTPGRWRVLQAAITEGRTWYYGDHQYIGRNRMMRITKNAYQHDGTGEATPDRFARFRLAIDPWRRTGSHVLVCPQSPGFMELHGLSTTAWVEMVRTTIAAVSDRPVKVRWKTEAVKRPIAVDLREAWAVVVFSSGAALDALLAGVPVFVTAPWAAAYRMGCADLERIEAPVYPDDREPFFWNLADRQFSFDEIQRGIAWAKLQS